MSDPGRMVRGALGRAPLTAGGRRHPQRAARVDCAAPLRSAPCPAPAARAGRGLPRQLCVRQGRSGRLRALGSDLEPATELRRPDGSGSRARAATGSREMSLVQSWAGSRGKAGRAAAAASERAGAARAARCADPGSVLDLQSSSRHGPHGTIHPTRTGPRVTSVLGCYSATLRARTRSWGGAALAERTRSPRVFLCVCTYRRRQTGALGRGVSSRCCSYSRASQEGGGRQQPFTAARRRRRRRCALM